MTYLKLENLQHIPITPPGWYFQHLEGAEILRGPLFWQVADEGPLIFGEIGRPRGRAPNFRHFPKEGGLNFGLSRKIGGKYF